MLDRIKISYNFIIISILLSAIYFTLEWYYTSFVHPKFDYLGFHLSFNSQKYVLSKVFFSITIAISWFVFQRSRFIYTIYVFCCIFFLLPNLVIYAYMNTINGPIFSIMVMLIVLAVFAPQKLKIVNLKTTESEKNIFIIGTAILFLIPILINPNFKTNFNTLLLSDITSTRLQFDDALVGFMGYLYNWLVKMVLPLLAVFFLIKNKYLLALVSLLLLMYLYVISGNKSVYMTTIIVLAFYFLGNGYINKVRNFLLICLCTLIAFYAIDLYQNGILFRGIFVMRVFFFPALLNVHYFDFFAGKPLYFAESSGFNLIFQSPYSEKVGYVISKVYFNANDMYANNGIISDGYMNLGYWGIAIFILLFTLIFLFFNSFEIDEKYFGVFFVLIFFFISSPMLTIMITGGIWFLMLSAFFILKKQNKI